MHKTDNIPSPDPSNMYIQFLGVPRFKDPLDEKCLDDMKGKSILICLTHHDGGGISTGK